MTIGIPKAFIYWKKPIFWEAFFEALDFKVILSPPTNKEIVEIGVKISDPETCFSQKVYFGHLLWLEGKCDFIFVPRLKRKKISGGVYEYCPKFFGTPDLAKLLSKTPILTETFDEKRRSPFILSTDFKVSLERLGKKLGKSKKIIEKATKLAFLKEKEFKNGEKREFQKKIFSKKRKIVIISHPYNFYDSYVNLRLKEKLEGLGAEVIFIEAVEPRTSKIESQIPKIKFHWEFGKEIMEKIGKVLKYQIDGAIEISSFQCGCDSVLKEFVEREFKLKKIPFLYLLIDEHTGEAGFQTRLEAFLDTI